jgi:hypothetical protein
LAANAGFWSPAPAPRTEGRREHGFRFFPGFYKHITDTMSRIPFGSRGANCRDNLVQATRILLARQGKADPVWIARFPESVDDFQTALLALFDNLDIPHHEVAFFVTRLLALATSCAERYHEEFEQIAFWDFIEADARSENYRRYLGQGMTRSLVAMRAEESSTRTVGRILLQLFYGILVPGRVFDRLLNGPTNDVWIDPWRAHLTERLGGFWSRTHARSLISRVTGCTAAIERSGRLAEVTADSMPRYRSRSAGPRQPEMPPQRHPCHGSGAADRMDERHQFYRNRSTAGRRP